MSPRCLLSRREQQVLSLASHGHTMKEMAIELHVKQRTIEHYIMHAKSKLQARNLVHAVYLALKEQMLCDELS